MKSNFKGEGISQMRNFISVIIPVYNEELLIENSIEVINNEIEKINVGYEIILIDDGSKDNTWEIINELIKKVPQIRAYRFSRNFGKESALSAGLDKAKGDAVILMDCDLQHPPMYISQMVERWKMTGSDIVECVKESRGKEGLINKLGAKVFYNTLNKMTGYKMDGASDFKLLDRKVVNAWKQMKEHNVFFRGMSAWLGFTREIIYFEVPERMEGTSKWSLISLLKLAISAIVSFSALPLRLVSMFGIIFLSISIILGFHTLYGKFTNQAVTGFTTVILLILFTGSILMISLGIIGEYVAAIYNEVKNRPRYVIAENVQNSSILSSEIEGGGGEYDTTRAR